jgi:hypothetical protein
MQNNVYQYSMNNEDNKYFFYGRAKKAQPNQPKKPEGGLGTKQVQPGADFLQFNKINQT